MKLDLFLEEVHHALKHGSTLSLVSLGAFSIVLTDSIMTAWLGASEFSGVAIAGLVYSIFLQFGVGCTYILAPQLAEATSRGFTTRARIIESEATRIALSYAVGVAFLLVAISLISQKWIVYDGSVHMHIYMFAIAPSIIPQILLIICEERCIADNKTSVVLVGTIWEIICNAALNYIFMFVLDFGVVGAALSTLLTTTSAIFIVILIAKLHLIRSFATVGRTRYRKMISKRLKALGLPLGGLEVLLFLLFAQTTVIVSSYNVEILPAHIIVFQITELASLIYFGFGEATATRIASHYGRRSFIGLRHCVSVNLVISAIFGTILAILTYSFSDVVFKLYAKDGSEFKFIDIIYNKLIIYGSILVLLQAIQINLLCILRGLGDTTYTTIVSTIGYGGIGFIGCLILVNFFSGDVFSVWLMLILATVFVCLTLIIRLRSINASKLVPIKRKSGHLPT